MRAIVAAALIAAFAAPLRADEKTDAQPNGDQTTVKPETDVFVRYGPQVIGLRKEIARNPELLTHPDDLKALVVSRVQDPRFLKAFVDNILSQYGKNSNGTTTPTLPPANEGNKPPVAGKPSLDEAFLRSLRGNGADPNAVWTYKETGDRAFARNDPKTSFNDYTGAIEHGDTRPEIYVGYGVSAYVLGDYKLASDAAKIVLASNPANRDALALYHTANGRAPTVSLPSVLGDAGGRSAPPLNAASALPGADAALPGKVGGTYAAPTMTPEQAAAAANAQAAAAGPDAAEKSAMITREAANALRVRDYPTAHGLATKAIEYNAANAQALNFRAIASNKMYRYADAVRDASLALNLAPGNAPALQTRSWAFAKQGQYKEALEDAEATLARDPNNQYAYQNKALALAGLHDRAGAIEALRRSATIDPRYAGRLEQALQMPQDKDLTLLFDDDANQAAAAAAPVAPGAKKRQMARVAVLSLSGGLLVALGILHVVSASWREKVNATIRRALGPADSSGSEAVAVATPTPSSFGSAFWTQYEVVKEIGLGGMGVVYEAKDRSLERRVAVKKMRDEIRVDPQERRRFINEAKLVAQLRHPNIVDIYGISEDGDDVYLVFEFVDGRTLHDQIKSGGPLTPEQARGVLRACADAVEAAHARQIVHRDLKPSNIMITTDGRVKVMDFGVARQAKDALTKMSMTNTVVGTPPYMAPEQEQGTVRKESDVYALGIVLYEMLTGHMPFNGQGAAMLLNKLNGKHIPPSTRVPGLPAGVDAVMAKVLAPDPDKRYRSPSELVAALDAALAQRAS